MSIEKYRVFFKYGQRNFPAPHFLVTGYLVNKNYLDNLTHLTNKIKYKFKNTKYKSNTSSRQLKAAHTVQ